MNLGYFVGMCLICYCLIHWSLQNIGEGRLEHQHQCMDQKPMKDAVTTHIPPRINLCKTVIYKNNNIFNCYVKYVIGDTYKTFLKLGIQTSVTRYFSLTVS